MRKPKVALVVTGCVVLVGIIVLLTYASLLGENARIDNVVEHFFQNIKQQDFQPSCDGFSFLASSPEDCAELCFLLELSLLKKYSLLDEDDYQVEMKRSHFWIPYLRDDGVRVGIQLRPKAGKSPFDKGTGKARTEFVEDLMLVERKNGAWAITDISISDTSIAAVFGELRSQLRLNKYLHLKPDGFAVNAIEADTSNMTSIDRHILRFVLRRAETLLNNS